MRTSHSTTLYVDSEVTPKKVVASIDDDDVPRLHVDLGGDLTIYGTPAAICAFAEALRFAVCEAESEIEAGAMPVSRFAVVAEEVQLPSVYRSDREIAVDGTGHTVAVGAI